MVDRDLNSRVWHTTWDLMFGSIAESVHGHLWVKLRIELRDNTIEGVEDHLRRAIDHAE